MKKIDSDSDAVEFISKKSDVVRFGPRILALTNTLKTSTNNSDQALYQWGNQLIQKEARLINDGHSTNVLKPENDAFATMMQIKKAYEQVKSHPRFSENKAAQRAVQESSAMLTSIYLYKDMFKASSGFTKEERDELIKERKKEAKDMLSKLQELSAQMGPAVTQSKTKKPEAQTKKGIK